MRILAIAIMPMFFGIPWSAAEEQVPGQKVEVKAYKRPTDKERVKIITEMNSDAVAILKKTFSDELEIKVALAWVAWKGIDPAKIDKTTEIGDLGFDEIDITETMLDLEKALGKSVKDGYAYGFPKQTVPFMADRYRK